MPLTLNSTVNVVDGGALELAGAFGVTTAVVSGTTYLFVAGFNDDGVSVFSVASDGTLTNVFDLADTGVFALDGARSLSVAEVGGTPYLFVAGSEDDGISVFSIAAGGSLTHVNTVTEAGDPALALNGVFSITTAVVGTTTYLFAAGFLDDGVSVFSVANNGTLTEVDTVSDDMTRALDGAFDVATAEVGAATYLFVTGRNDDGVSVFSVATNGTLTDVTTVSDDVTRALAGAQGVTTAEVGGTTYLFVSSRDDDGISVFSVATNGTLTDVDAVFDTDDAALELDGARKLTTTEVGGVTYLIVTGEVDAGISVFSVATGGTLTNVANVPDAGALLLNGPIGVTATEVDGDSFLFVAGRDDNGVSGFLLNTTPEGTTGTVTATGNSARALLAADFGFSDADGDTLDSVRIDTLTLASGTFELSGIAVGATDIIEVTDITAGNLVYTPAEGASGSGLLSFTFSVNDGTDFADTASTLTVDVTAAPPPAPEPEPEPEPEPVILTGGTGQDTLEGGDGNDSLTGGGGDDTLKGDDGNDVLTGGAGNDSLKGDRGKDTLAGGDGNDTLKGGIAADSLTGGAGDDSMRGDQGSDTLTGGDGNDTLDGGSNADLLFGNAGDDRVSGGSGNDTLFAGAGDAGQDTMDGGRGDDIVGGGAGDDIIAGGDIGPGVTTETADPAGSDTLFGGTGDDLIAGGSYNTATNSAVITGDDANLIWASSGNDRVFGDDGDDTIGGGLDDDSLTGAGGNDILYGGIGSGDDTLNGGAGDDQLFGADGTDRVSGGSGNDTLFGGAGNDTVDGGSGDDRIWGSAGDDVLSGGAGDDTFAFITGFGTDTISDFGAGGDSLDFSEIDGLTLADIQASATFEGGNTILTIAGHGTVILAGLGPDGFQALVDTGLVLVAETLPAA